MPRVIIITTLTLWSMGENRGGPAFTKTVQSYSDAGWDVYLISDELSNKNSLLLDTEHAVLLPPTVFKQWSNKRKIGLLFRWLDHRIATRRFCRVAKRVLSGFGENRGSETVIYAYEVFGAEACARIAAAYSLPLVTRFQGTILSQYDPTLFNRITRYPHFQALAQKADLVIMTDDGTQGDRVLQRLGNTSKTLFLRNGLDLMSSDIPAMYRAFERGAFRAALGASERDTVFLTVSRLTGWKRVDRAVRGFAEFIHNGGSGRLVVVGDGDKRQELEALAAQLQIEKQVVFTGAVPHDDVYHYMMACDVFLSLYDLSNVGNPLLEAMALGKCIVTYDVGDTGRIIRHRENGILLTEETLPQLGEIMGELAADREIMDRYASAAASYAAAHFCSWKTRMEREIKAVRQLAEHSASGE